jgi:hypothetical protein
MRPEEARQFGREFRERRRAAEALRRELASEGASTADLERLLGQMRALEEQGIYDDPDQLERLQASVIEGFKAFEFALRRRADGATASRPVLGGSDDLPAGFRQLVEEYYRSLARTAPR